MISEYDPAYIRLIPFKVTLSTRNLGICPVTPCGWYSLFQNRTPKRKQDHPAAKHHIQATYFTSSFLVTPVRFNPRGATERPGFIGFISCILLPM